VEGIVTALGAGGVSVIDRAGSAASDVDGWAEGVSRLKLVTVRFDLAEIEDEARSAAWQLDSVGKLETIPAPTNIGVRGDWDWSRDLSQGERARLKRRYTSPGGMPPDVFADVFVTALGRGRPDDVEGVMDEWLRLTRIADAVGPARQGRDLSPKAYGGTTLGDLFNPARQYEDEGEDGYAEDIWLYDHERDADAFQAWCSTTDRFGVDVETTAFDRTIMQGSIWQPGFGLRTVQVATRDSAWVFDVSDVASREVVSHFLADTGRTFVSHTAYDAHVLAVHLGIDISRRLVDSWMLAKLADSREYEWTGAYKENRQRAYRRVDSGLKALVVRYLKDTSLFEAEVDLIAQQKEHAPVHHRVGAAFDTWRWANTPIGSSVFLRYAGLDAICCLRLAYRLRSRIRAAGIPDTLVDNERWLQAECLAVTHRGIALDVETTSDRLAEIESERTPLERELREATGVSPRSPAFAEWLEANGVTFGLDERTETGRGSLKKDVLPLLVERYRDAPTIGPILAGKARLAGLENRRSNLRQFLAMADPNGRVHPEFKTVAAVTGRMSITRPALQTLRKGDAELRTCFIADPGNIVLSADFDQVEIRVAAALSRDGALLEMIRSGQDVHGVTAARVFGDDFTDTQRQQSKTANFAILYGAGAPRVAKQLGISVPLARQLADAWRDSYPGLVALSRKASKLSPVVTGSGRHIPVDPDRTYANGNYLIQSTARDLLVDALCRYLSDSAYADSLMVLLHDEIVVQVPRARAEEAAAWLEASMTIDFKDVPISAHVERYGTHWAGPRDDDRPPEDDEIDDEAPA
jgi:DNA polymerase-1